MMWITLIYAATGVLATHRDPKVNHIPLNDVEELRNMRNNATHSNLPGVYLTSTQVTVTTSSYHTPTVRVYDDTNEPVDTLAEPLMPIGIPIATPTDTEVFDGPSGDAADAEGPVEFLAIESESSESESQEFGEVVDATVDENDKAAIESVDETNSRELFEMINDIIQHSKNGTRSSHLGAAHSGHHHNGTHDGNRHNKTRTESHNFTRVHTLHNGTHASNATNPTNFSHAQTHSSGSTHKADILTDITDFETSDDSDDTLDFPVLENQPGNSTLNGTHRGHHPIKTEIYNNTLPTFKSNITESVLSVIFSATSIPTTLPTGEIKDLTTSAEHITTSQ